MDELGIRLRELGDHLDVGDAPSLAAGVVERIDAQRLRAPVVRRRNRRLLVAALAVVVGGTSVAAGPAVADWLRLRVGGVEVRRDATTGTTAVAGATLDLGRQVTLEQARGAAAFPIRTLAGLEPARPGVWIDDVGGITVVSLAWRGVLLQQFDAPLAGQATITKSVSAGTPVEEVDVDGAPGLWVGGPHIVALRDGGDVRFMPPRLAGNTLVWESAGVTYRLESTSTKDEVLALASTLEPR